MARIFLSTPTKMPAWLDVARQLSRGPHQVVGQLTHLPDELSRSSIPWKLIDATQPRREYLSSTSLFNAQATDDYSAIWSEHGEIFRGLLNRKIWYAFRGEEKSVLDFFCSYWKSVLKNTNPSVVVFATTPHTCYDYPLLVLAKRMDIETILFTKVPYTEFSFVRNSIFEDYCSLQKVSNRSQKSGDNFVWSEWLERCRGDYSSTRPSKWDKSKNYSKPDFRSLRLWSTALYQRPFAVARLLLEKLASSSKWDNLEETYVNLSKPPDYSKRYVYLPLHFQPERTTSPEGGVYHDQTKFATHISESLPNNTKLYIREHPSQFKNYRGWMGRSSGYYDDLLDINSVELISLDANPFKLIDNATAVASVAGTAVIESIIRGTPATIGGYPWFCPGIPYPSHSKESMQEFFSEGLGDIDCMQNRLSKFMHLLPSLSERCYIQGSDAHDHSVSRSQNADALCVLIKSSL